MARKPAPRKPEQAELDEFAEKYETFASVYDDPMEVVFTVMSDPDVSNDLKLQAAGLLLSFRFPKLKAVENKNPDKGQPMQFTINLVQQEKPAPTIDVTPPVLKLVGDK